MLFLPEIDAGDIPVLFYTILYAECSFLEERLGRFANFSEKLCLVPVLEKTLQTSLRSMFTNMLITQKNKANSKRKRRFEMRINRKVYQIRVFLKTNPYVTIRKKKLRRCSNVMFFTRKEI